MAIIETTWKPSIASVEKKNTKYALAQTIIEIWREVSDMEDSREKDLLLRKLLVVL